MSIILNNNRLDGGAGDSANKDLSNLSATGETKFSKVSVSNVGTSTDTVAYIIVDGVENKITIDTYTNLDEKPVLNTVEINGTKTSYDYNIVWKGTQAEYDAIITKNPNTLYCITDDSTPATADYYTKTETDALLDDKQDIDNMVAAWQASPDDSHYPSEKLVKDSLTDLQSKDNLVINWQTTPDNTHYPSEALVKTALDNKVSVSASGTATDVVDYITIDGVEKKLGTTAVTLQVVYDLIHPVGEKVIGFEAPTVPTGVTANWGLNSDYDGKSLWVDSTQTAGTALTGSLPEIEGQFGMEVYGFVENNSIAVRPGNTSGAFGFGDSSGNKRCNNSASSVDVYEVPKVKFKASSANSIYNASAGTNVVRPTSTVVHVYERLS